MSGGRRAGARGLAALAWGLWVASSSTVWGCAGDEESGPPPLVMPEWSPDTPACDPGNEGFVRRVIPLLWGRHPYSLREVELLTELLDGTDRKTFLAAMMDTPDFTERAHRVLRDIMGSRSDVEDGCGGPPRFPYGIPELAAHVRDNAPDGEPFVYPWNLSDLTRSAILLDDMSPLFIAGPFTFLAGALVDQDNLEEERATRTLVADLYEDTFLNRRMACLGCHNSEYSVTGSPDPALDRTWEIPGHFEKALYGSSDGRAMAELSVFLRIMGSVSEVPIPEGERGPPWWQHGPGVSVWGMTDACARFVPRDEVQEDPLGFSGYIAGPVGPRASAWDLVDKIRGGFAKLRVQGRAVDPNTLEVDGELALAYLTTMRFAEHMWTYVNGRRLTIPNGFPRNQAQRDVLESLTQTFVASGFSLKALFTAVLTHPWSVLGAPADCDQAPYFMPAVFDPWVRDDQDLERRGNSVGDAIVRDSPWIILDSATTAMGWPAVPEYALVPGSSLGYVSAQGQFLREVGVADGPLRGFRDSSFAERLAFEEAFGSCTNPNPIWQQIDDGLPLPTPAPDWLDAMVAAAGPDNTVADGVMTLKDRLLSDPTLEDPEERELTEALLQVSLDAPLTTDALPGLRRVCAALLMSPQFMISALPSAARSGAVVPVVVPGSERSTLCTQLAGTLAGGKGVQCVKDHLRFAEAAQ